MAAKAIFLLLAAVVLAWTCSADAAAASCTGLAIQEPTFSGVSAMWQFDCDSDSTVKTATVVIRNSAGSVVCSSTSATSPYTCNNLVMYHSYTSTWGGDQDNAFTVPGDCALSDPNDTGAGILDCSTKSITVACAAGTTFSVEIMHSDYTWLQYTNQQSPFTFPADVAVDDMINVRTSNGFLTLGQCDNPDLWGANLVPPAAPTAALNADTPTPEPPADTPTADAGPPPADTPTADAAPPAQNPTSEPAPPAADTPTPEAPPPVIHAGPTPASGTNSVPDPSLLGPDVSSVGDPHVTTLDGVTVTYLACGDNIMIVSHDFMYQARHCSHKGEGSSTCAVALKCSKNAEKVELYAMNPKLRLRIGNKDRDIARPGQQFGRDVIVTRTEREVEIQCVSSGFKLKSLIHESTKFQYFDSLAWVPDSFRGHTNGLMGVWDGDHTNDVRYASGEIWSGNEFGDKQFSALDHPDLTQLQQSWMVGKDKSLFSLPMTGDGGCNEASQRKLKSIMSDTSSELRSKATQFCESLGLDVHTQKLCVFDYMATGDKVFASNILASRAYMVASAN